MGKFDTSSYDPPTDEKIFSYPYIVAKNSTASKEFYREGFMEKVTDNLVGIQGGLKESIYSDGDTIFKEFKKLLIGVITKEREKEKRFIDAFLEKAEKIKIGEKTLADELRSYEFESESENKYLNYSKIIDTIQKYRMNLLKEKQTIQESIELFNQQWPRFSNEVFYAVVKDLELDGNNLTTKNRQANKKETISGNFLDMKIDDLIETISNFIITNYGQGIKNSKMIINYEDFVKRVIGDTINSFKEKNIEEADYEKTIRVARLKGKDYDSIFEALYKYLVGVMNGFSAEEFLIFNNIGIGTGRVTKDITTRYGKHNNLQIKADVIEILNTNITFNKEESEKISSIAQKGNKAYEELEKALSEIDPTKNFIIHTSIKDAFASNNDLKIADTSGLDLRLNNLKEIEERFKDLGDATTATEIEALVFAIANAGDFMIANGMTDQIVDCLTYFCIAYMFDDYADLFSQNRQLDTKQDGGHLHLYFIKGNYFTISDILTLTLASMSNDITGDISEARFGGKFLKMTFKPTSKNEFEKLKSKGIARWEEVRKNTFSNSKIGLGLNAKVLLDAIYGDINSQLGTTEAFDLIFG